jgi:concanavalin A-like lectin/glucanase superfamily protein
MCKKLMLLVLVSAVMAAGIPAAQAQLITAVAHRNADSDGPEDPQISPTLLDEGAVCFVDRTHAYADVPESLIGAEYIILANDNKNMGDYELDITLSQNATVYVFVDNRMGGAAGGLDGVPNIDGMTWLGDMGFVDTGIDIGIDESADGSIDQYFSVFALDVKAGITTTGGNTEGHGGNMLGVAAMNRTPAESAHSPSPESEVVDVPRDQTVSWEPGEEVSAHDVYLGTSFDDVDSASRANSMDVLISQGQSGTTLDVGRLEFGQTYYWRIDEVLIAGGIYKGEVWSFTVEPFAYAVENIIATTNATSDAGLGIENTINGSGFNADAQHSTVSADMWLGLPTGAEPVWIQYEFDQAYKLDEMLVWNYNVQFEPVLGFGLKDVTIEYSADGEAWTVLGDVELAQATAREDYAANTAVDFGGEAVKLVRIAVNANFGGLPQYGLSEVRFMYIPATARDPQPASDAVEVSVDSVLSWRAGREAASHEVYLGTDAEALTPAGSVGEASYTPDGLDLDTTYYWKVDEVNEVEAISVWEGGVWSFTTQEFLVVDDFESYNDEDNVIYESWIDGWINETGSTVGYVSAPFAEQTVVNSGSQSMPLFYDNAGLTTAEVELGLGQNWTTNGIQSLSLQFHGDPANTGQLYVKINSTKIPYDGDLTSTAWKAMTIDLSTVGGNLSNVSSLTIGVEGAGATGVVYIDDIRLYGRAPEFVTPVEPDSPGLLWWAFDEGSGTVATDSSGSGHDGAIEGSPTWVAGKMGGALEFSGGAERVVDADAGDYLNGLDAVTIAIWIKSNEVDSDRGFIIGEEPDGGDNLMEMRYDAAGAMAGGTNVLKIAVVAPNDEQQLESSDNLQTTEWQHVTMVWSRNEQLQLYVNGELDTPAANDAARDVSTSDVTMLIVGQGGKDAGRSWNGLIDDVRIYDSALSAGEVLWLAGGTTPVAKPF